MVTLNLPDNSLLIYAFRYALGRQTYAVDDVILAIHENIDILTDKEKQIIIKEIEWGIRQEIPLAWQWNELKTFIERNM